MNTTDTEQAAKSVAGAAYVLTVASEASARNVAAAKSAGTAAKGALRVAFADEGAFHSPSGAGITAGNVKAQVYVSTASGSINQRASYAAKLRIKQLLASARTAQENQPNNLPTSICDGSIVWCVHSTATCRPRGRLPCKRMHTDCAHNAVPATPLYQCSSAMMNKSLWLHVFIDKPPTFCRKSS